MLRKIWVRVHGSLHSRNDFLAYCNYRGSLLFVATISHAKRRSKLILQIEFANFELHSILLWLQLLLELSFLCFLFSHKPLVVLIISFQREVFMRSNFAFGWIFLLSFDITMRLPGWVINLAVHQFFFLHFREDGIYLLGAHQLVDSLLVLRNVAVNEVQAFCYQFQLVHYLL